MPRSNFFSSLNLVGLIVALALLRGVDGHCADGANATAGDAGLIELHRLDAGEGVVRITLGIPFAPGSLTDPARLRVLDEGGEEIPIHAEPSLRWHFKDDSIRALRVQLRTEVGAKGRKLRFDVGRQRARTAPGWDYAEGLFDAAHGLRMPRVLATLDADWLAASLLAGPQQPVDPVNAYDRYVETQFEWAKGLPDSDSTAWLFDRTSTLFKLYVRSGRLDYLRSAVESYRFYMGHLQRNDKRCPGGWQFGRAKVCDAKYVYIEPIVLALGLTGDDSLHDANLVGAMVRLWDRGGWSGIGAAYARPDQNFTERHAGLGLLATVSAFELIPDPAYRKRIDDRIGWLLAHQQDNPDGLGDDGSWRHSWQRHEGETYAPASDVRGASPWMSENIIDGLWHAWLVSADRRIPGMVAAFGQYLETFGWIDPAVFVIAGHSWRDDCSGPEGQIAWYWSSSQAPLSTLIRMQDAGGEYSDAHTVELGLAVAAARYFEPDAGRRRALDRRLGLIAHSYATACASNSATARRFNWNNRGAGVVNWFKANFDRPDPPGIPARPR
jgi:hypothetical protein